MDGCIDSDRVVSSTKKLPSRSVKKRVVYFDKSDSELECDEDGDDEASAPAARHVRAASAARGTAKGGFIVDRTSDEGSDDDEAEASVR